MARVLANKNIALLYVPTMVISTDYVVAGTDSLTIKTSVLSGEGVKKLHSLVTTRDYQLGASGEEVVNDPPLSLIGTDENVPGRVNYTGQLRWFQQDTTGAQNPWDAYIRGTTGWLIERRGLPADDAFAADQLHIRAFSVTFGVQQDTTPGGGEYLTWLQSVNVGAAYEHSTIADALS